MPLLFSKKGSIDWWTFIRYRNLNFRLGIRCGPLSKHPLPPARHLPHLTIAFIRPTFPGINPDKEMRQCINKSHQNIHFANNLQELLPKDSSKEYYKTSVVTNIVMSRLDSNSPFRFIY